MLALLGSLLGLLGSLSPRLIQYFEQKQSHAQELEMLKVQGQFQLQMIEAGHTAKLAEISAMTDIRTELAAFAAVNKPTGIKWVDAFNGFNAALPDALLLFALCRREGGAVLPACSGRWHVGADCARPLEQRGLGGVGRHHHLLVRKPDVQ